VLNSGNWQKWHGYYLVDLKLPRFEIDSDINLKAPLQQLGIQRAFVYTSDGFEDFCYNPTWIDLVKQSAKIIVSEEGTEAAAVTVIGMETTSIPDEAVFHANRPFFYIISELSTGAIFFMGQYMGASAARPGGTNSISEASPMNEGKAGSGVYDLSGRRVERLRGASYAKGLYISNGRKYVVK
jgi:hypothetical protein